MLSKEIKNIEIGIIVPVYNAQQSLHRCIDSILIQSYSNFKLILIDDGSEDDSLMICRQYQKHDSRIIVYSQNNSGVSTARNKGIELCTSPYLCFTDSDDYLEPDYLQIVQKGLFPTREFIWERDSLTESRISTNTPSLDISVPKCTEQKLSNAITWDSIKISVSVKTVSLHYNI